MKLPIFPDAREIARAFGGLSAIERALEGDLVRQEQVLHGFGSPAVDDLFRTLGGISAIEQILEHEHSDHERMLRQHQSIFGSYREMVDLAAQIDRDAALVLEPLKGAIETARLAGSLGLPDMLEQHRVGDLAFAARLADAHRLPWWDDLHVEAMNTHSALSGMFDGMRLVGQDTLSAIDSVLSDSLVGLDSVRQAREFLDISGLLRFPRFRILTRQEKRRRVKLLIRDNALPTPVKKAQGLVHRYEKILRVLIAQCMEDAYGEEWANERLPLCDCKKLLGKTLAGDESILDHADYVHYALIMCHDEHFAAAFSAGYENVEVLRQMIHRLGQLRARAHHGRTFTSEDLRELAALWRAMEAGFVELVDDVVIDT